jgi:CelD/BcsL family acetyltransferase involved in cellulose biosynthesis
MNLHCRVERSFADAANFKKAWDDLAAATGAGVYLTYDWSRLWWEFYGANRPLRLLLFFAPDELVGVLPLYIDRLGPWPVGLRLARLVGSNVPPKAFNPPVQPAWAEAVFQGLIGQVFGADACDALSLGPVSERHAPFGGFESAARAAPDVVSEVRVLSHGVHSLFELPATYEQFVGAMPAGERKKHEYETRVLKRERSFQVDVVREPERLASEYDRFVVQHALQWEAEGKAGHFGAWPKARDFNRALLDTLGRLDRARFVRLLSGDDVIASQYSYAFGRSFFWELPARVVGPDWKRFSLGRTGAMAVIQTAIGEGCTTVEGGLGHYDYKVKMGAREPQARTFWLTGAGAGSRWRTRLARFASASLRLGYHKLYYKRVRPRLRFRRHAPQSALWLRFDF